MKWIIIMRSRRARSAFPGPPQRKRADGETVCELFHTLSRKYTHTFQLSLDTHLASCSSVAALAPRERTGLLIRMDTARGWPRVGRQSMGADVAKRGPP